MVAIVTRAAKGSPLSNAEQDANITNLKAAVEALATQVTGGVFVTGWTQDPDTRDLTIEYSDGTVIGPISLPVKALRVRGAWQPGVTYDVADVVRRQGSSFIAQVEHLSGGFDADLAAGRLQLLAERGTDGGLADAPSDGESYARKNGGWIVAASGGGMFRDRGAYSYAVATGPEGNRYMRHDVVSHEGRLWIAAKDGAGSELVADTVPVPGHNHSDYDWTCLTPFSDRADNTFSRTFFADRLYVQGLDGNLTTLSAMLVDLRGVTGAGADAPEDGKQYGRQDGEWSEIVTPPPGVEEAPADGKAYARQSEAWQEIVAPSPGVEEAPEDGKPYARQDGTWMEVVAGSGGGGLPVPVVWENGTAYPIHSVVDWQGRFWIAVIDSPTSMPAFRRPDNYSEVVIEWRCLTPVTPDPDVSIESLSGSWGYCTLINGGATLVSLPTIIQTLCQRILDLEARP